MTEAELRVVLGIICFLAACVAAVIYAFRDTLDEIARAKRERRQRLTIDEAQAIVSDWEEMTEDERAALPLERRVEIRKIREALGAHKKKRGMK